MSKSRYTEAEIMAVRKPHGFGEVVDVTILCVSSHAPQNTLERCGQHHVSCRLKLRIGKAACD